MKIFEDYLNEGTSKQIEVPGWKKSTKAKLIKELTDKKSLYVSTWGPSDKDGEYILDAMKEEFTDSKLKKVFSFLSSAKKWRTVSGASQTKLIFRPEGRVDFNQVGDKWFYEKKLFGGTVFLFYTRNYNEQWNDWSHLFIFYYVPDNIEGEWLEEKSGWDSDHPKYILQFNVGLNIYYKKKTSKNFSFTKLDWNINDYITDNIKEADIQDTPEEFKALKKELEVKYPKVLMHLFPNKKVRLSVTTYYTLKEEQEIFAINEDWNSDITKVFGKQFLTYTYSSQFLNDNDIDIAKSDYEVIDAPYSLKKFKKYPLVIIKPKEHGLPIIFEVRSNGDWFIHKSNGMYTSIDFDDIVAAVGIKKVVRNTELKQKRKDNYKDTWMAKNRDPIFVNREKRMMRSFKEEFETF